MKTKQEIIQEAYGEELYQELHERHIDPDDGFCKYWHPKFRKLPYQIEMIGNTGIPWRPKSLSGIENNNGWTRIKEDGSNLPKWEGEGDDVSHYWVMFENGDTVVSWNFSLADPSGYTLKPTHYQPIVKPKKPLY